MGLENIITKSLQNLRENIRDTKLQNFFSFSINMISVNKGFMYNTKVYEIALLKTILKVKFVLGAPTCVTDSE